MFTKAVMTVAAAWLGCVACVQPPALVHATPLVVSTDAEQALVEVRDLRTEPDTLDELRAAGLQLIPHTFIKVNAPLGWRHMEPNDAFVIAAAPKIIVGRTGQLEDSRRVAVAVRARWVKGGLHVDARMQAPQAPSRRLWSSAQPRTDTYYAYLVPELQAVMFVTVRPIRRTARAPE